MLVAADGSRDALHAARAVTSLGALRPVRVRVLGVVEPVRVPATVPSAVYPRLHAAAIEWQGERKAKLAKALSRVARLLRGQVASVKVSVAEGVPAEAILAAARRHDSDVIVVGARGLGPVRRLLLGSVSDRVLREARRPVLVARRPRRVW